MKPHRLFAFAAVLSLAMKAPILPAQGVQPHPDAEHTVVWYPRTKIFAQQLCEDISRNYAAEGIQFAAMHGNVRDTTNMGVVLASSEGLDKASRGDRTITWKESIEIGLPDTAISTLVSGKDECIIFHPHANQQRCAVRLPLLDSSGKTIRVGLSLSFTPYRNGDDPLGFIKRAIEVRAELAKRIPSIDALYEPATDAAVK